MTNEIEEMFQGVEDETAEKILARLMEDTGIELKTDIPDAARLASLNMLAQAMRMDGYIESSKLIEDYITVYLKYKVSEKRQGRKEIVSAIAAIKEEKRSFRDKMAGPPV